MSKTKTMTKRDLAEAISDQLHVQQDQTIIVVQAFLDAMAAALCRGDRIEFRDFGVFQTVTRKARVALNPKTLEKIPVGRRRVVKFKAGRLLKQRVLKLPVDPK